MKSHYEILKAMKTGFSTDFRTAIYARSISSKEYERYISGELPLILSDSVGKPLASWSITGNTVQDGEPTPDNPVEVKGIGDVAENLFTDKTVYHNTIGEDSFWYASSTSSSVIIEVQPNTKYYIKTETILPIFRIGLSRNRPDVLSKFVNTYRLTNTNSLEITTGDNINYLVFQGSQSLEITWLTELYVGQGYKIDVVTRGKNLFDFPSFSGYSNFFKESFNQKSDGLLFKDNTQYTISFNHSTTTLSGVYKLCYTYTDGTESISNWITSVTSTVIFTSQSGKTVSSLQIINYNMYVFVEVSNIILNEGSEPLPYEPYIEPITTPIYLNSPLMADEVLNSEGNREVEFKKIVLTGDELYTQISGNAPFAIYAQGLKRPPRDSVLWMCSHYQAVPNSVSWVDYNSLISWSTNLDEYLVVRDIRFSDIADFKAFIKSEYDAGHPVTIYYQLAEPTSETVDVPQIPTLKGNCVLDIDTEVQPTGMTLTYKSRR